MATSADFDDPAPAGADRGPGDDEYADAIGYHVAEVATDPLSFDAHRALFQLWRQAGDYDRACSVAGLLLAFDQAGPEETRYHRQHAPTAPVAAAEPISPAVWDQCIRSPAQEPRLSQLMALLVHALPDALELTPLRRLGRGNAELLHPDANTMMCHVLRGAAQTLGLPLPRIFIDDRSNGVALMPTIEPALRVGSDLLLDRPPMEMAFLLARGLTYAHPWHRAAALASPSRLQEILEPALGPVDLDEIQSWTASVEATANRAGAVVTGDLAIAGRLIGLAEAAAEALAAADFARFAISEELAALHEMLGDQRLET